MQQVYIPDERDGMSPEERNIQLSAVLATAPNKNRDIVLIERDKAGQNGWWITYR